VTIIWINGVKATINGPNWTAANVPLNPGGTEVLLARAIPKTALDPQGSGTASDPGTTDDPDGHGSSDSNGGSGGESGNPHATDQVDCAKHPEALPRIVVEVNDDWSRSYRSVDECGYQEGPVDEQAYAKRFSDDRGGTAEDRDPGTRTTLYRWKRDRTGEVKTREEPGSPYYPGKTAWATTAVTPVTAKKITWVVRCGRTRYT
jgi:hypothetical protein